MSNQIQLRGDTAAVWTLVNPVLADREMGLETDTDKFKIGDGSRNWSQLPYGGIQGEKGDPGSIDNLAAIEDSSTLCDAIDPSLGHELFLDGVKSDGITSKGRRPIEYSEDFEPAVINVDGSEVANPVVKFPNRGVHGYFGEYENLISGTVIDNAIADSSNEGSWLKVTATASAVNSTQGSSYYLFNNTVNAPIVYAEVKRGNATTTMIAASPSGGSAVILWTSHSFDFYSTEDAGSYFISDDLAIVRFKAAATNMNQILLYAKYFSNTTIGDYSYFKNIMVVDQTYPVPYVEGKHLATYGKYDFDWASSDAWTIEGWFKTEPIGLGTLISNGQGGISDGGFYLFREDSDHYLFRINYNSTSYDMRKLPQSLNEYNHIKLIMRANGECQHFLNGVGSDVATLPASDFSFIKKSIVLGDSPENYAYASMYLADLVIKPYADESNTHYLSGLPYYNPEAQYLKNGAGKISKDVVSVPSLVTQFDDGSGIYEQYTEGEETVIKYNSGLMVNYYTAILTSVSITTAKGNLYESGTFSAVEYIEEFIEKNRPQCFLEIHDEGDSGDVWSSPIPTYNKRPGFKLKSSLSRTISGYITMVTFGRFK